MVKENKPSKKEVILKHIVANGVLVLVLIATIVAVFSFSTEAIIVSEPIRRGQNNSAISILISAQNKSTNLEKMVSVFNSENERATIFATGITMAENPSFFKRAIDDGHEIASLGFFYIDHSKAAGARTIEELDLAHRVAKSVLGIEMKYFLPPMGRFNNGTISAAESIGYTVVFPPQQLIATGNTSGEIYESVTGSLGGGDLILIRPCTHTIQALPKIIDTIREKGYNIVSLSEILQEVTT